MLPEFWWANQIGEYFHITHMISTYFTENKNILDVLHCCKQIVLAAQNRFLQITDIVVQCGTVTVIAFLVIFAMM